MCKKDIFYPRTGHENPGRDRKYTSTLSLTSPTDGRVWSAPRPGRFIPGKKRQYSLHRRLYGAEGRSGEVRKISAPPGFDPVTVQPVVSRYTEYANPAHESGVSR